MLRPEISTMAALEVSQMLCNKDKNVLSRLQKAEKHCSTLYGFLSYFTYV